MTTHDPRPQKATSSQGLSSGIAIGAGLGVIIGAAWDNKHPPTT
jgi:hypothetical protein